MAARTPEDWVAILVEQESVGNVAHYLLKDLTGYPDKTPHRVEDELSVGALLIAVTSMTKMGTRKAAASAIKKAQADRARIAKLTSFVKAFVRDLESYEDPNTPDGTSNTTELRDRAAAYLKTLEG